MVNNMKKTKIIATIGPKTRDEETIKKMILNGMDVARINLSHASHEFCLDIKKKISKLNIELNKNVAILLDTCGPNIRTGKFENGKAIFKEGDKIRIYTEEIIGDSTKFSISCDLTDEVYEGSIIKINAGSISLKVLFKKEDYLLCEVLNTGTVYDNRSVHIPKIKLERPFLSQKDIEDIEFAEKRGFDYLALSFVSSPEDVLEVNDMLIAKNNNHLQIISKIESANGVDDVESIIKVSDGIMIARGDLGIEVPLEEVPSLQKKITKSALKAGKMCVIATDMLATMEEETTPTRAEVSDIANAVMDGVDAVMLSEETAIGKYPLESVTMMNKIIEETEKNTEYYDLLATRYKNMDKEITNAIAYNVVQSSYKLDCKAIIVPTMSGHTARVISSYRPKCPIIAVTPNKSVLPTLMLNFGVIPVSINELKSLDRILDNSIKKAKSILELKEQDKVIITGGYPFKETKSTNFMKIEEL